MLLKLVRRQVVSENYPPSVRFLSYQLKIENSNKYFLESDMQTKQTDYNQCLLYASYIDGTGL